MESKKIYNDPTAYFPKDTPVYMVIDLKSFFASVECVERGLDPMTAKLVVADPTRSKGTICLAVTPALKALGVKNRCRIYEIPENLDYIIAPPQMQHYLNASAEIYEVYLQYISKDDIHVYSVDEAFLDVTHYLDMYHMTAKELGIEIMNAIWDKTGIRSTCGIGTNLYLAKVALDITAKHASDFIGILTEDTYRETLWTHQPLTDFWMVGRGISTKLYRHGILNMKDLAAASVADNSLLFKLFGIDAEILIDHAFGVETVTMADIKNYHSESNCLSSGQVLMHDYNFEDCRIVVLEMMDQLCLDMVAKDVITDSVTIHISYSHSWELYPITPPAHGSIRLPQRTNSDVIWRDAVREKYNEIVRPDAPLRRISISCNNIKPIDNFGNYQYSLFDDDGNFCSIQNLNAALIRQDKTRDLQKSIIDIKRRFGKNSVLKGMSLQDAGTMRERNMQIGGHKSGNSL